MYRALQPRGDQEIVERVVIMEQISLNDGTVIPQLGLGVWQVDRDVTAQVVGGAIEAGYRLIDTAEGYANEEGVGEAIRQSTVPRPSSSSPPSCATAGTSATWR